MATKDVKMAWLESDIEKVQVKTNMYIQKYGYHGVFQMIKEGAQNCIDELSDEATNGSKYTITHDKLTDKVTIEDDGRGIPEDSYPIDIACTKLYSPFIFTLSMC